VTFSDLPKEVARVGETKRNKQRNDKPGRSSPCGSFQERAEQNRKAQVYKYRR